MKIGIKEVTNPLEVLECIVAFDSRDWANDKRDRMIYAIVFGWDDEVYESFGWDENTIAEYQRLHERFEKLKEVEF